MAMTSERISSGIPGLDRVLNGGFIKGGSCLIKGGPGTGKTLFGLYFLSEGVRRGEKSVFISFDENVAEVKKQGKNFKLPVEKIEFIDKFSTFSLLGKDAVLWSDDAMAEIVDFVDSIESEAGEADRLFIDGIGVISDCVKDKGLYRRIVSTLVNRLSANGTTTLISSEAFEEAGRGLISYIVGGEILLDRFEKGGRNFRILNLLKFRGDATIGVHYFEIKKGGIEVYPIVRYPAKKTWDRGIISTGNAELDSLFGGGIMRGAYVMVCGKTGVGKTNMSLQLLVENDRRGEKGILYTFDESRDVILERIRSVFGYEPKNLVIREASLLSNIGEFYDIAVDDFRAIRPSIVVIDPLNSLEFMARSREEMVYVMEMLKDLVKGSGGIIVQVVETYGAADVFQFSGIGISQFADYILLGRHVELGSEILKAIAVLKNRFGNHERSFRILDIEDGKGLVIGKPLSDYTGLISGTFTKL
jgi:circadian clock protein KaiC